MNTRLWEIHTLGLNFRTPHMQEKDRVFRLERVIPLKAH